MNTLTDSVVSPRTKLTQSVSRKTDKGKRYSIVRTVLRTGSGEFEISRTVSLLGTRKSATRRTVAFSPVRIDKRTDRFFWELDRRLRKGGL